MQFDDFYETVGVFSRYQKVKYFLICLTYMLPPIMVYTWTFTAATPSFRCRTFAEEMSEIGLPNNISQNRIPSPSQCRQYKSQISTYECQRCYQYMNKSIDYDGPLKPCTNFVFDRTYYQSTLVEEWSMVCSGVSLKSFVQMIFFFGYMIGSLIFGILSDQYGRRPIMGLSFCIITFASFLCAFAPQEYLGFELSYLLFMVGRFLVACATRGVSLTGFVIGVEIVGPKQRLFTGIVVQYFFAIGQLILLAFAYMIRTWRLLHIALAILSVPFLFFYFILPESPRWLVSRGYYDEAKTILLQIAKTNKNTFDSKAYQHLVTAEKKKEAAVSVKGHGLKHLLKSKVMCIISINMSFQWFVQNLVFYGISQNTGSWLVNPYISFGAGALIEIAAYFIAHRVLNRWGRKTAYSLFVIGFAIFAFLVVPIQMLMIKGSRNQMILMFIVHVIQKFFATGSYAIIYIYANELFPTHARNTGIGFCSMVARIGAILGTLSNDLLTRIWLYFPVVAFGLTSIIAVAFIAICPETFNKPLPQTIEDVEEMGLVFWGAKPKQLPCSPDDDNIDEDILLNGQLKNNAA